MIGNKRFLRAVVFTTALSILLSSASAVFAASKKEKENIVPATNDAGKMKSDTLGIDSKFSAVSGSKTDDAVIMSQDDAEGSHKTNGDNASDVGEEDSAIAGTKVDDKHAAGNSGLEQNRDIGASSIAQHGATVISFLKKHCVVFITIIVMLAIAGGLHLRNGGKFHGR